MLFTSPHYLVFFLAVFAAYWALPWHRARVWLLLVASFCFYATWNSWLALLVLVSASFDWWLARAIAASASPRWRRVLVTLSVTANLGLLCYFKYVNFFLESLQHLLRAAGCEASLPLLSVILPIGISFYTFEAISYVVDVYRGHLRPEPNLANFLLFILFFPHLVAGPIVRGRDFLPQVRRRKRFSWFRALVGVILLLLGLCKKRVIADRMAMLVDPVFADPGAFNTGASWLALFGYALQVYGDFSGYTDMALGSAHLLGYHLAVNFRAPFLSPNITEFWRRWHISLSSWLRDYLFYPLGGSRSGWWRTSANLLLTMTLCGLWHGANWNFIAFGFLQGLMLIAHRAFAGWCRSWSWVQGLLCSLAGTSCRVAFTFVCFCLSLAVFRNQSLEGAWTMLGRLFHGAAGAPEPLPALGFVLTVLLVLLIDLAQSLPWAKRLEHASPVLVGAGCTGLLLFTLLLTPESSPPFVYFQF